MGGKKKKKTKKGPPKETCPEREEGERCLCYYRRRVFWTVQHDYRQCLKLAVWFMLPLIFEDVPQLYLKTIYLDTMGSTGPSESSSVKGYGCNVG